MSIAVEVAVLRWCSELVEGITQGFDARAFTCVGTHLWHPPCCHENSGPLLIDFIECCGALRSGGMLLGCGHALRKW